MQDSDSVAKGGGSEGKGGSYARADDYLKANNMVYRMPADLSVASSRKLIKSYFQQSRYSNIQTATCILNSGDAMIDGRNSYLQFKLERKSVGATGRHSSFGSGSALNLVRQILITTANGVEIDRVEGVNHIYYDFLKYSKPKDWFESVGTLMGYGDTPVQHVQDPQHAPANPTDVRTYCIPLRYINGLFASDKLLYSGIMSGLKLEIQWENPDVAFHSTDFNDIGPLPLVGVGDTYSIVDPCVVLDSHILHDFAMKQLHTQSSQSVDGIEILFSTFDRQFGTLQSTERQLSQQSRKAVTRAGYAWMKSRLSTTLLGGLTTARADSFLSEENKVVSYQFNLGSLYFPNQAITEGKEMYANSLYCFGELNREKIPSVSYADFNTDSAVYPVVLEKSTILDATGLPLISGRSLNITAQFGDGVQRQIDVVIQYTKLVKVFLTNAVVKQ